MNNVNRLAKWLFVLTTVLAGCTGTGTLQVAQTATLPTSQPSATFTTAPTSAPPPTETPTPSPTVTPMPHLNAREPTLEQLQSYLLYYAPEESLAVFRGLDEYTELIYEDVSGDGEADLIVSDFLYVAVMVWMGDQYGEPFQLRYGHGPRNPWSHVLLNDWTMDGTPEVVFDYRTPHSGSDISGDRWVRHIIHCTNVGCDLAWRDTIADYLYNGLWDGMSLYRADARLVRDGSKLYLEKVSTGFVVYCGTCFVPNDPLPRTEYGEHHPIRVTATVRSRYAWNGAIFDLIDEQVISDSYVVDSQTVLEAASRNGVRAVIFVETPEVAYAPRDVCQLLVDDEEVGEPFICRKDFTTVQWRDITNDGEEEVVIVALSGRVGAQSEEKGCVHQRLLAYQFNSNDSLAEVANVTGCVVQADLFGVRLQDVDGDDQPEIVAAGERMKWFDDQECIGNFCWYELNNQDEVYRWDGERFVYWRTVLREVGR